MKLQSSSSPPLPYFSLILWTHRTLAQHANAPIPHFGYGWLSHLLGTWPSFRMNHWSMLFSAAEGEAEFLWKNPVRAENWVTPAYPLHMWSSVSWSLTCSVNSLVCDDHLEANASVAVTETVTQSLDKTWFQNTFNCALVCVPFAVQSNTIPKFQPSISVNKY